MEYNCEICGKTFKYKKGLSKHLSYTHKTDLKIYYDKWVKEKNEEICKICGEKNSFRGFRDGYTKICKKCLNKSKFPCNKEYWIYHNFSKEESVKKVSEFQTKQSKKVKKHTNDATLNHWVKLGFSKEESEKKIKERQTTFSLEKCIKKFGKIEGTKKWKNRQIKWQETLNNKSEDEKQRINKLKGVTLENMIRKWGTIDGTEKYNDWKMAIRGYFQKSISSVSQELFFNILNFIKDKENTKFGRYNKEFYIYANNRMYYYDFKYKNKIIEFNGDIFHANPKIYNENDFPNPYNKKINAKTIWELDNVKLNLIKNMDYDILIIWEKDYEENKQRELNKCLKFLNISNE
jgi:hypothetical protein